jgi:branched-chain amino acid transport system substrate-binding protein
MIQNVKLKHFVLLMMAVLTGLMIWPGCAEEPSPPAPKKTGYLYVGLVAPKSGPLTGLGESMIRGAELAVDAANEQRGEGVRPVKLMIEDELRPEPDRKRLAIDPRLMVFVGFLTEKALDESREVYIRAEKPVILPVVTSARAPEQAPGIYHRMVASDDRQAASLAEFARDELKVKSVLIVHDGSDYGNRTTAAFQKVLGTGESISVEDVSYPETPDDLAKLADRVAADPPGAVFLAMYAPKAVNVAQALSAKETKTVFLGTSVLGQNDTLPLLERLSEKFYLALPMNPLKPSDSAAALVKQYEGKYHRAPNWISFTTYDAVGLAVAAMREVGDEPGEVNRYLSGLADGNRSYDGVTGTYRFGPQGQGLGPVYIVRAESSLLGRLP